MHLVQQYGHSSSSLLHSSKIISFIIALVSAPLGLAVFACCGHRLLARQLAVLPDGMAPGIICPGIRILGWSCVVLRSFVISRCVWFIMFVIILFFFRRPPRCPCLIRHMTPLQIHFLSRLYSNTSKRVQVLVLEESSRFWGLGSYFFFTHSTNSY